MVKAVWEKLENAEDIAVIVHINEDADAVGSVFAFTHMLKSKGKNPVCYMETELSRRLRFLGSDYEVYVQGTKPVHELCVALDCGNVDRFGNRLEVFENAKSTICIDHHKTNPAYADLNIIIPDACATGEILFNLFKEWKCELDDYSAKCLYAAICGDSGGFQYSNTTPDTMRAAAELLEFNFDHAEVARLLFDTKLLSVVKFSGHVMNNIESYADGKIQLVVNDEACLKEFDVPEDESMDLVNIPRSVEGCEIAVEIKRRKGVIRLSLRSNSYADVSVIASKFGGGGHTRAAGATVDFKSIEEAKSAVIAACKEVL